MSQQRKRAYLTLIIWGIVAVAFAALFFFRGGPDTFYEEDERVIMNAGFILAGWIAYGLMLYLTRAKPGSPPIARDERDEMIGARANATALVIVLMYVFLACIVIKEAYGARGSVPLGWMWFLAYSSVFVGFVSAALLTLILDVRMSRHGQG
jgi:hypothetical protein